MQKFRILIAEDDDDDFYTIRDAFKERQVDYDLERAEDGQQLLKRLSVLKDSPEYFPDLILLDINMPKVNGMQALQKLKEKPEFCSIPVVMHSTASHADFIAKSLKLGAVGYAVKGASASKALMLVDNIVNFLTYSLGWPDGSLIKPKKLLI